MSNINGKKVCVIVLGDIGRSPRMQYHSLSLANSGFNVNLIGYNETNINSSLTKNSNIHINPLKPPPTISFSKLLNYIVKTIWQTITLLCALAFKNPDCILVQNPPAVPTLFTSWFYCILTRSKFIIDWHNYAYTIMSLNIGEKHVLVKITKFIEAYFGRKSTGNICVTNAMKLDLKSNWQIDAVTLYDRAPKIFHPISLDEKHAFLKKLSKIYPILGDKDLNKTVFTEIRLGKVELRENRPALLISSTSWTEDEDFSILLNSLQSTTISTTILLRFIEISEFLDYDRLCKKGNVYKLPKLICIITGKGPLKEFYMKLIENEAKMEFVSILTPWLESEDYPTLLASADLGICLHTSSSGLDLPMKVVDMFGCGLPVCAIHFNCLNELVKHNENSFVFKDTNELNSLLFNWFENFPKNKEQQRLEKKFKLELSKFQELRWEKNWDTHAKKLFI